MDKEKIKEGKGNKVLLTIIAVATLLVSVVGATFAYFTAVLTTGSDEQMVIKTAVIGTIFEGGNEIVIPNVSPQIEDKPLEPAGQELGHTKVFTITATGSAPEGTENHYKLGMEVVKNTFAAGDLKYSLTYNGIRSEANGTPATDKEKTDVPTNPTDVTQSVDLGTGKFFFITSAPIVESDITYSTATSESSKIRLTSSHNTTSSFTNPSALIFRLISCSSISISRCFLDTSSLTIV